MGMLSTLNQTMAKEEAVKKLDDLLKCSVCLDTYTNPRMLPCSHVYCQDCLIGLVVRGEGGNHTARCANCREATPVPSKGVAGFLAAYRINELKDIHKALIVEDPPKGVSYCSVHEGKELELFCETCEELICLRCAYKGGEHHNHGHQDVDQAFESFKEYVIPRLEAPRKSLQSLFEMVNGPGIIVACHQLGTSQHESVRCRNAVLSGIKAEIEAAQGILTHLFKLDRIKKRSKREEVLVRKRKLLSGFSRIEDVVQSSSLKLESPDPSLCRLLCKGLELTKPRVGEEVTVTLKVVNFRGVSSEEPPGSLECVLLSLATGTKIECGVKRTRRGQYLISYKPAVEGRHQLCIQVDGQHIRGSPCTLLAELPVEKSTKKQQRSSSFNQRFEPPLRMRPSRCLVCGILVPRRFSRGNCVHSNRRFSNLAPDSDFSCHVCHSCDKKLGELGLFPCFVLVLVALMWLVYLRVELYLVS